MAWTPYHDQLAQQAIALMTEPNWADNQNLKDRLDGINDELQAASSSLGAQQDARMQSLLTDFQNAYNQGRQANESRFSTLSGYKINPTTGAMEVDPSANGGLYQQRTNNLVNNYYQPVASGYASAIGADATRNTNALTSLAQRNSDLSAMFNGLGNQAKADVSNKYAGVRAKSDQDLTSRGLGNATVRSSAMAGINSQEAQDLSRVNEGLRREQIGYQSQWTDEYQKALQQANTSQRDLGLQSLGYGERMAGAVGQLTAEPLGVIERRTDTTPNLGDIANMTMQLGRGSANTFALPALGAISTYQNALYGNKTA